MSQLDFTTEMKDHVERKEVLSLRLFLKALQLQSPSLTLTGGQKPWMWSLLRQPEGPLRYSFTWSAGQDCIDHIRETIRAQRKLRKLRHSGRKQLWPRSPSHWAARLMLRWRTYLDQREAMCRSPHPCEPAANPPLRSSPSLSTLGQPGSELPEGQALCVRSGAQSLGMSWEHRKRLTS